MPDCDSLTILIIRVAGAVFRGVVPRSLGWLISLYVRPVYSTDDGIVLP